MAKASLQLISALRNTAHTLSQSSDYQWGHMGACNCGFLAQQVTQLSKSEIHHRAMQGHGDWNEQLNDYCPTTGLPMDQLISDLLSFGFDIDDLKHLERLTSPSIIQSFSPDQRPLRHNSKADVVAYLNRWADLLEDTLLDSIHIQREVETMFTAVI